jgi:predicted signal transduction protein with EAL and GGDEF domain
VKKLLASVAEPVTLAGQQVRVTASVGVSVFPDHGDSVDALLRGADSAMYRVKGSGRNGHQSFDPSQPAASERPTGAQSRKGDPAPAGLTANATA